MMTSNNPDYFDLIPEYLQGTLDPETHQKFEQEMETNDSLKIEVEDFSKFRTMYHEIDAHTDQPSDSMFHKISNSIDQLEIKEGIDSKETSQFQSFRLRILEVVSELKDSLTIPWGIAVLQTAVIVLLLLPGTSQTIYKTLGSSPPAISTQTDNAYNIVFKQTTHESEIRVLLLSVGGTIISGPSEEGR
ncbi:MAG: hypothetical protein HKN67_07635, partial [Saprospiraceae bacterium]|nr:hypothetical protein [Saprospiraceae bacterium]